MSDVIEFPIREAFPGAELSSFAWLSGPIPPGKAYAAEALCVDAPNFPSSNLPIVDMPGVYAWLFDRHEHWERSRFRMIHFGESSVSMRERTECHVGNAYSGTDSVWDLRPGGRLLPREDLAALKREGKLDTVEATTRIAETLGKVRILFIAVVPTTESEEAKARRDYLIRELEGALIHAANRDLTEYCRLPDDSTTSNSEGKHSRPDRDIQERAWKAFNELLSQYADA